MAFNKTQYRKIEKIIKETFESPCRDFEGAIEQVLDPEIPTDEDINFISEMVKQYVSLKLYENN